MKIFKISIAALIIFVNTFLSTTSNAESSRVILDQLLTGDVPQLNADDIQIPDDLKPGFHELQVEVLDDTGVISSRTALFCKDLKGELHFDNKCPDLLVTNQQTLRSQAKPYSPLSDPIGTATFALVAFAVGGALLNKNRYPGPSIQDDEEKDEMDDLGSVAAAKLLANGKDLAWGDRRRYINSKLFRSLDKASLSLATGSASFSNLLGRSILDARYLRAIFGNLTWITIPASILVTYLGLQGIENEALPLAFLYTAILICIGIFDAFAGLVGAFLYLNFIFANGNFDSSNAIFTGLGTSLLFFAPGLIASKFRPLTRTVRDFTTLWERLTDYVLASLLTGWTVMKLIQALPGLAKIELEITQYAGLLGVIAGGAVASRLLFEEIAWYLYPVRLRSLTISIKPTGWVQEGRAILFKTSIFYLLAAPFVGFNDYLWIGCGIFVLPQLISLFAHKLPKSKYLAQINPKGALKIVLLSIISVFALNYLKTLNLSPSEFILTSFVFLPLPALFIFLVDAFSGDPFVSISKNIRLRYWYRILGLVVLGLLVLIILGKDPYAEFRDFIEEFPSNWQKFLTELGFIWENISNWLVMAWDWISHNVANIWNWLVDGWRNSVSF